MKSPSQNRDPDSKATASDSAEVAETISQYIRSHAAKLELYARQWTTDPANCVQQAFVKLATCDPLPDHPANWLFQVVRNLAISQGKSETARRTREKSYQRAPWFEESSSADIDIEQLQTALSQLDDDIREVIVAHIWGELSFTEIAKMTEVAVSTIQRRYHKGLRQLKKRLREQCQT